MIIIILWDIIELMITHLGKKPSKGGNPPRLNKVSMIMVNVMGGVFVFIKSFE